MFEKRKKKECILALVSAVVIVVCTCVGVVMNLTTLYDVNFDHMGIRTFCMFTVNSNILMAVGMSLVIPYAIDGMRKPYYRLPGWLVDFLFAGATAVTLTFLVSLFVLSPVKGFILIFTGSRFFLHGVCPILGFLAFSFFISNHRISLEETCWALIPVLLYAFVYFILAILIGAQNGGWDDFYGVNTYVPFWIPMLLIMPLTFGIASGIRFLHNRTFRRIREWRRGDETDAHYLEQEIEYLARLRSEADAPFTDLVIPRRFIRFLIDDTDSDKSLYEACCMYLKIFLENSMG